MDIEDLSAEHDRPETESSVLVKTRFRNKKQNISEDLCLSSNLPEKFHVFVQTWGCAHNTSDSEYMTGLLAKYGYQVTLDGSQFTNGCESAGDITSPSDLACGCQDNGDQCCSKEKSSDKSKTVLSNCDAKKNADVWVLNSCTVKGPAEDHFRNAVLEGIKLGKRVVAAGCVPQSRPGADYLKGVSVIGVHQIDRIVEVVEETLQGNVVRFLDKKYTSSDTSNSMINSSSSSPAGVALDLPKIRRNPLIEILAISTGCLNACTYCKTKQARGILASYPIEQLLDRAKQAFKGNVVRFLDKKYTSSDTSNSMINSSSSSPAGVALDLPKIRRNPLIEILAISTGCLNACTYCKTKQARGILASYPIEQLLDRAKQAFKGVKELWLTSEDLGAYGRDLDRTTSSLICPGLSEKWPHHITLADLLAGLVPIIPAGCMLRLGMTNPPYILDQLVEIAEVLSHPRVYSFLHIPVQSGSDAVLDAMKREYTIEEFSNVVDYLMQNVKPPNLPPGAAHDTVNGSGALTIATDVICGFPTETDNDFNETVELIEKYQFPVLHINQKASSSEVKSRTRRLHDLFRSYRTYDGRVGCEVRVLITEPSFDGKFWVGHTKAYEQVCVNY
ncbi:threonylcarbamoyladenosine tRNA methylthiotransferase CDKAL1 [Schistosoma bovis]|uniref:Threonylcarbamoyladenosine tRNA methylthiotransferase n=1 Tax=Schistosoma bovis TaxID=6184 RepID=A0A430Q0W3_SCHBO|nr:threonylcarbamoyladenosine tRNA methylthiotransferase CDKAL1 [Schistosoma bovis]